MQILRLRRVIFRPDIHPPISLKEGEVQAAAAAARRILYVKYSSFMSCFPTLGLNNGSYNWRELGRLGTQMRIQCWRQCFK